MLKSFLAYQNKKNIKTNDNCNFTLIKNNGLGKVWYEIVILYYMRDTFGIKFPKFTEVFKSIKIRHDLVHRSGKTKKGDFHKLDKDSIIHVTKECSNFVNLLEEELKEIEKI